MKKTVSNSNSYYYSRYIIRHKKFNEIVNSLRERFSYYKCPLPAQGFSSYKDYDLWLTKLQAAWRKINNSTQYKAKRLAITKGQELVSLSEYNKLEELDRKMLPPLAFMEEFTEFLESIGITSKHPLRKEYNEFIWRYVFFGRDEFPFYQLGIKWSKDSFKQKPELSLVIYRHTKRSDIEDAWTEISKEQKLLQPSIKRDRQWKNFDRDMKIYELYLALKGKSASKRKGHSIHKNQRIDAKICSQISQEYSDIDWDAVRKVIQRVAKFVTLNTHP